MQRELAFGIKVFITVPKTIVFGTLILSMKKSGFN